MRVDSCELGRGATEHSLSVGDLRLTVVTTEAATRRCTVARRVGDDVLARHGERYEIIYSTSALPPHRTPKTVDELAIWTEHRGTSSEAPAAASGDSVAAAALIETTARTFGASAAGFVSAVHTVAPTHLSAALAELQC